MSDLIIAPHRAYQPELADDYDALSTSLHLAYKWPHDPAEFEALCSSQTSTLYIGKLAERAVAMAVMIKPVDSLGHRTAIFEDLAVHGEFQGRGIGGELMTFLEEEAVVFGATRIELHSRRSREAAQGLYKKSGFEIVDTNIFRKVLSEI